MLKFITKILGSSNERALKAYYKHIEPINELEPKYEAMSDDEIKEQTNLFRKRLADGEGLEDIKNEAFAVVREAAKRSMGLRHYDVQLIGGLVLNDNKIAEMKTGEGKTMVATLAVYLNAIEGKGVHVVTVNDYLAQRDAQWMGAIYEFLGLSVGCITNDTHDEERREAYQCDVTYGTNNEFGFDYLRDNMKFSLDMMVQREFNFAIVDEVDSILIDEARTPLIISGPSESDTELYTSVDKLIPSLTEEDYEKDEKHKTIVLTEDGQEHVEQLLREHGLLVDGDLYDMQNITLVHHTNQALRAHKLFHLDKDYIVKEKRVILIDEFTGRMMDGRRLSEGLHQAIEAKEGADIQNENQTLASITFQNYFRLYPKLAGMTGTAMTEASEFQEIYKLGVLAIPTNVPVARIDEDDQIYRSLAEKEAAIVAKIKDCQDRLQPVLVGTVSIENSETLSATLKKAKIKHNVLNARHHEQEAYIVAQAGRPGTVTIATNMAGRGTDIKLGGNLDMRIEAEIDEGWTDAKKAKAKAKIEAEIAKDNKTVMEAGGLFILCTERHESRRIDNQLRGRAGRQGDAGGSIFFLSVEDDLMRIFAGDRMESLLNNKKIGLKEGEALEHPLISKMLEHAQGKVEGMHFEVRKNLLKFDDVMNDQRKAIYEQRREVMDSDSLEDLVKDMRHDVIEDIVSRSIPANSYAEKWDAKTLHSEALRLLGIDTEMSEWFKEEGIDESGIIDRLIDLSDKKVAVKTATVGTENWRMIEKSMVLQILDQHWKEHLLALDHLRQGINLRAFGQKDPLNEYKTEAFGMFEMMLDNMRERITQVICRVQIDPDTSMPARAKDFPQSRQGGVQETRDDPALAGGGTGGGTGGGGARAPSNVAAMPKQKQPFDKNNPDTWGRVQRNAACPCDSGKKFKHCHGSIQQQKA